MKRGMICIAAVLFAAAGLLAGCNEEAAPPAEQPKEEEEVKEKTLRDLPEDFAYRTSASDYTVSYTDSEGREISLYGKITEPDEDGTFPAVIMSHGFNGRFNDFDAEAKKFASRGYVCYGFDFCGAQEGGKSTGRTGADYTPFTMKEDLLAVIADIGRLANVDKEQIFLLGGSQGGLVTGLAAADPAAEIAGVALYFPAFNIPDDWKGKPETETELMGYTIGAEYIRSVQNFDPYAVIGGYKKDVCIIWGDQDGIVKRQYIDKAVETYGADRADLTVIEGAGHGFSEDALKTAIAKVLAFLEARTYE